MKKLSILTKGIFKENPVLVFLLGLCPTLAVSTQASNAIGMGAATTFVLLGSNIAISLCRRAIPDKVRIPCYIVLIAGFVTLIQMIVEAYAYPLYMSLGIFLPLIACNCIVFARAEVFANKNTVIDSILDAVGMGAGFTLALFAVASLREIFGSGTWYGLAIPGLSSYNVPLLAMAPGGFIVFAVLIAILNKVSNGKAVKKKEFGCAGCPSASVCGKGGAR
ncbi:MAG: electron transport complex subunit E [Oscillospiraceae bacterium]|nr:electron transport complex subunit E [Oscillospiraceae bacterium]